MLSVSASLLVLRSDNDNWWYGAVISATNSERQRELGVCDRETAATVITNSCNWCWREWTFGRTNSTIHTVYMNLDLLGIMVPPFLSNIRPPPVFEKTCATSNNSKIRKSHVFWILKKRKKRKKRTYSFTGHLITQPLIHNYRKSVPVSHQYWTSCWEMWTQETMQLRTVCELINAYESP